MQDPEWAVTKQRTVALAREELGVACSFLLSCLQSFGGLRKSVLSLNGNWIPDNLQAKPEHPGVTLQGRVCVAKH
jgi:hypothetical protein